ncbi:DUF1842 domain-containing protein [Tenacibaculum amylolyticum]|uniref:DUF1842 domain-containing protein n=1 Tax=Tenacibaculum amylolyticum TaxID=104269 RepID=UPI003894536A
MENSNTEIRHYFNLKYRISNNLKGGSSFTISLIVDTNTKEIVGKGHIFKATSHSQNVPTILNGDFSYMATMSSCNILVVADGYSPIAPLVFGVPQPIKNVTLRMSLEENWKSGTAIYSYLYDGQWIESGYQKVELIELTDELNVDKLASITNNADVAIAN